MNKRGILLNVIILLVVSVMIIAALLYLGFFSNTISLSVGDFIFSLDYSPPQNSTITGNNIAPLPGNETNSTQPPLENILDQIEQ
tara:strand:+ start:296 stop:550 length:255 start_codon:yes stop_codon:yes gene_type:complete